jgi:hypothetical protein
MPTWTSGAAAVAKRPKDCRYYSALPNKRIHSSKETNANVRHSVENLTKRGNIVQWKWFKDEDHPQSIILYLWYCVNCLSGASDKTQKKNSAEWGLEFLLSDTLCVALRAAASRRFWQKTRAMKVYKSKVVWINIDRNVRFWIRRLHTSPIR